MSNINAAINRIKALECPTGQLEERVTGILQQYQLGNQITVKRDKAHDQNGSEAYKATIAGDKQQEIIILAEAGMDDYVIQIIDAHLDD